MSQAPVPNPPNPVVVTAGNVPWDYNTPMKVITEAGRNAGYLGLAAIPNSQQIASWGSRLLGLINVWQTQGLKLWLQQDVGFTAVQGQNRYVFGPQGDVVMPRPPRILEAYWQDSSGTRRPLMIISRNEWNTLSTLVTQGAPNSFFPDKQQQYTVFNLWLTPDLYTATQGQIHILAQTQVNQITNLNDQMNFPPEWFQALHWGLGLDISQGQPASVIQLCQSMSTMYFDMVNDWDVEDASTFFQPDVRNQYIGNSFK